MKGKEHHKSPLPPLKGGTDSPSMRGLGGVKRTLFLVFSLLLLLMSSCKTKEVPGRRRAPRHCNTCTKWSYTPQQTLESELLDHDEA